MNTQRTATYAIVLPTFNNSEVTIACLKSIAQHTEDYIMIWVDDGSDVQHYKHVEAFLKRRGIPHHALRSEINHGFITAMNTGLMFAKNAGYPYIVMQNNDTIVYDRWLSTMRGVMDTDTNIGLVGPLGPGSRQSPQYLQRHFPRCPYGIVEKYSTRTEVQFAAYLQQEHQQAHVVTYDRLAFFCTLVRAEILAEVGFLDVAYGKGYYDDNDYCERVLRAGWDLTIACGVYVAHDASSTFAQTAQTSDWEAEKKQMFLTNEKIFKHKFGYDHTFDLEKHTYTKRGLEIRTWRLSKHVRVLEKELADMKQSLFWRLREKLLCIKNLFHRD